MSVFKSEMRGKTIELNKSDAAVGVDVCWKKERNAKRIKKAAICCFRFCAGCYNYFGNKFCEKEKSF